MVGCTQRPLRFSRNRKQTNPRKFPELLTPAKSTSGSVLFDLSKLNEEEFAL